MHGLQEAAAKVDRSCENGSFEDVQQAQSYMQKELQSSNILQDKHKIDCNSVDAMARIIRNYMNMVEEMLLCIRYVRGGQWELHLSALHQFSKQFFRS